jgi:PRTase ComF-like
MTLQRIAAHSFDTQKDIKFDPSAYSLFKYGSRSWAHRFGKHLAQTFFNSPLFHKILSDNTDQKIIVLPPPCIHIPTAGHYLADAFFNHLNQKLHEQKRPHAWFIKTYRQKSYFGDYGKMSSEERRETLADEVFKVDAAFLKGHICLFVDDIRITGAHEERVMRMLEHYGLQDVTDYHFLFYAMMNQTAALDPTIESRLNRWGIEDLEPITKLIKRNDFVLNTRVLKFILSAPPDAFKAFTQDLDVSLTEKIYFAALNNGYAQLTELSQNFLYLKYCIGNETTSYLLSD